MNEKHTDKIISNSARHKEQNEEREKNYTKFKLLKCHGNSFYLDKSDDYDQSSNQFYLLKILLEKRYRSKKKYLKLSRHSLANKKIDAYIK